MITAESMLSKRPILRITAALFLLLKLFSSHIYWMQKLFWDKEDPKNQNLYQGKCSKKLIFVVFLKVLAFGRVSSRVIAHKIKSLWYSRYYAEACNEWRNPSPGLSAWTPQLWKNIAAVASCWRHCVPLDRPGNQTQNLFRQQRCLQILRQLVHLENCFVYNL